MRLPIEAATLVRPWLYHGLTDALHVIVDLDATDPLVGGTMRISRVALPYLLAPVVPSSCLWPLFSVLSVAHFVSDIGFGLSIMLHASLVIYAHIHSVPRAFTLMCAYLTFWHLPQHCVREIQRLQHHAAAPFLLLSILLGWVWPRRLRTLDVSPAVLRIAMAHIVANL